jgi:hypothetical protein
MKCEYCEREVAEIIKASANHSALCPECVEHLDDLAAQWD